MAVETTGSTVPRRQLGRYLRELRNRERLTVKVAAEKLEWSEAKIWRIETGQTSLRSLDVEAMCKIYGAPADLTEALIGPQETLLGRAIGLPRVSQEAVGDPRDLLLILPDEVLEEIGLSAPDLLDQETLVDRNRCLAGNHGKSGHSE